jgi:uncharacterized protein (TIGR01370 family)
VKNNLGRFASVVVVLAMLISVLAMLLTGCGPEEEPTATPVLSTVEGPVPTDTPVPESTADQASPPLAPSNIAQVWANEGGDKVTRDELRGTNDPDAVHNSVWDGTSISLFGARNEVVSFNLVLEAPTTDATNVDVTLTELTGPGGAAITTRPASGDDVFNYVGRNIELFYVRYLEIKGLSTDLFYAGYDYDERHIPERCRRPYNADGEGTGTWEDRPCHNKFYPEIAVPLELHSPFNIAAGTNQSIWGDIYIPKTVSAGLYTGIIAITEDGALTWQVPISLHVRDFTLPDLPNARTMLAYSPENINDRYLGEDNAYPKPGTTAYTQSLKLTNRHFQLAHRHKISLIDGDASIEQLDDAWTARLNGELFTPGRDYDGVGVKVGNNVHSIGTYGSWSWQDGTQEDMWTNTDAWVNWFDAQAFTTPTDYFLYLIDESDNYPQIEQWAQWIEDNPGPGHRLMSMATIGLPTAAVETPSLDVPTSWYSVGLTDVWQNAADSYAANPDKRFYMYNSNRPGSGSFAIEDEGVALRELAWGQYKMGVDRWFYWESTYYDNYQGNTGQTNVFQQAQTYGELDGFDNVLGETGWNYLNGDGVLFYPGTDKRLPRDSYGVMGPFASLRLKHWRRGIQDVDYLTLAAETDPERTAEIVSTMIPQVLWECGAGDPEDPTWVLTDISWSTDPDVWEAARAELADIIESAASTSQVVPPTVTASSDLTPSEARLAEVSHWFYLIDVDLEPEMVERIAASEYDMVVLDFIPSEENNTDYPMANVIAQLHNAPHPKLVIAYIDIGQAEEFRTYWQPGWGIGNPEWIAGGDPDGWEGNFPVAYWYDQWRDIWLGADGYLQAILEAGFDGVYLDWVEAYSDENVLAIAKQEGVDPRQEMIWWVGDIADFTRAQRPNFIVIAQNAAELAEDDDYLAIIDAIAQEQVWFDGGADNDPPGDCPLPRAEAEVDTEAYRQSLSPLCRQQYDEYPDSTLHVSSEEYLSYLTLAHDKGEIIFTVDYALNPDNVAWVYETSRGLGFVPFASNRALDRYVEPVPWHQQLS